jgi:hypothetical protein
MAEEVLRGHSRFSVNCGRDHAAARVRLVARLYTAVLKSTERNVPLTPMNQSVAMYAGAVLGAALWLALRTILPTPGAFLSIVISAWAGVGVYGLVRAEITIAGRGGKSPKAFVGNIARWIGLAVLVSCAVFTWLMLRADG